jgi:NTE family protein
MLGSSGAGRGQPRLATLLADCAPSNRQISARTIGAINAALIAGNRPEHRLLRLREFWDPVSSSMLLVAPLSSMAVDDQEVARIIVAPA